MEQNIVIDKEGKEREIGVFDLYLFNTEGYHKTYDANSRRWGLIDYKGNILLPAEFKEMDNDISSDRIAVKKDKKSGYHGLDGSLAIDYAFDIANTFSNGVAAVMKNESGNKFYLIDTNGKQLTESIFDYVYGFYGDNHLAQFSIDKKSGFIDNTGAIIIPNKYEETDSFSEELVSVKLGGLWGAINERDDLVIGYQFSDRFNFRSGFARVKMKGGYGYIDKKGEMVIPCQYSFATSFYGTYAIVTKDKISWIIDTQGNRLTKENYSHISAFDTSGLALVERNGLMGFINKEMVEVIPCMYKEIDFFYEGLAKFKSKDKVIFIDQSNNIIIERKCTKAGKFSDGLARFELKKKRGFINRNNQVVIEPKFDSASDFYQGYAICGIKI